MLSVVWRQWGVGGGKGGETTIMRALLAPFYCAPHHTNQRKIKAKRPAATRKIQRARDDASRSLSGGGCMHQTTHGVSQNKTLCTFTHSAQRLVKLQPRFVCCISSGADFIYSDGSDRRRRTLNRTASHQRQHVHKLLTMQCKVITSRVSLNALMSIHTPL